MSMTTALSGLIAAQQDISTTSHNIANVGTNAFRKSRAEFQDDYYTTPMDSVRTVVGSGTHMSRVAVQFEQGNFVATGQTLDMAIQGAGFFAVSPQLDLQGKPTEIQYTRNGAFSLDASGQIADSAGRPLMTWPVAQDGSMLDSNTSALKPVQIPLTRGEFTATSEMTLDLNFPVDDAMLNNQDAIPPTNAFDPADSTTYAFSTPIPVMDGNGESVEARAYFIKTKSPDPLDDTTVYEMRMTIDGLEVPSANAPATETVTFDSLGRVTAASGTMEFGDGAVEYTIDPSASNLSEDPFAVMAANHNGENPIGLSNLEVDQMGVIWANYGSDERIALARVAVANFSNPQGLRQAGNASFEAAAESGEPMHTAPGEDGLGQLQSGMLERSNVDLTEELVNLITAQRNYQANAKAMETSSSLMQTIMNIRN